MNKWVVPSLVLLVFFIAPLLWINTSTKLGCVGDMPCMSWQLFRGLFLWPFQDVWNEVGIQNIMISYVLFGIGTTILLISHRKGVSHE